MKVETCSEKAALFTTNPYPRSLICVKSFASILLLPPDWIKISLSTTPGFVSNCDSSYPVLLLDVGSKYIIAVPKALS